MDNWYNEMVARYYVYDAMPKTEEYRARKMVIESLINFKGDKVEFLRLMLDGAKNPTTIYQLAYLAELELIAEELNLTDIIKTA